MSINEEMAKLTEEQEIEEAQICLNCQTNSKCRGRCKHYEEMHKSVRAKYAIKRSEAKAKIIKKAKTRVRSGK